LSAEVRNADAACYQLVWNFAVGCDHVDRGCKNCCVQHLAGTYRQFAEKGVTQSVKGRYVWNGQMWIAPPDSNVWLEPQLFPGSDQFIFVNLMSDVCHEAIPPSITRLAFWSIAASRHVGMFCTKRVDRMAALIAAASAAEARLWKPKSLLGFSCFHQPSFDQRWRIMRALAEAGFAVYASLSPLLGPITLPDDYLALACWTIVSGEQGPHERVRDMDPAWARAVLKQCDDAAIPFFLREMSKDEIIPNDLLRRDFPSLKPQPAPSRIINLPAVSRSSRWIINIRGTSGSGKSWVARQWLQNYPTQPLYGLFGKRKPEAYECAVPGIGHPLFVIGPYETPCGGCDAIQPYGLILDLLRKYAAQGHVLFEGLLIGDSYGSAGALLDQLSGEGVSSAVIRLNTPLEQCLERVQQRRAQRGDSRPLNPENTIAHFERSLNSKRAFEAAGSRARWLDLSAQETNALILRMLGAR
jgi:protein gp37